MRLKSNLALVALCLSITASLPAANLNAMASALNGAYAGKIVTLRRFGSGSSLHYAENGDFVKGGEVGPWTLDAYLQIAKIRISRNLLRINGHRLDFMYDKAIKDLRPYRGPAVSINIKIDLASASLTNVQNALSRVFVSERTAMAKLAPDYWRPYLLQTAAYKKAIVSAPGTAGASKTPLQVKVTEPKAKHTPDPPYTREARAASVQGDVILSVIVGSDGAVNNVSIVRPLGMGLDDEAAETIKQWKFIPGTREGRPVAVRVMIDITFHLLR